MNDLRSRLMDLPSLADKPLPLSAGEDAQRDGFVIDNDFITVRWGGYEYHIELRRINTPHKAIAWVIHLGKKSWHQMTPYRIAMFLEALRKRFGWREEHP